MGELCELTPRLRCLQRNGLESPFYLTKQETYTDPVTTDQQEVDRTRTG